MLTTFLQELANGTRNAQLKKRIINLFISNISSPIPELAKELGLSVPTVTKLVNEMKEAGVVAEHGKMGSKTGRRSCYYGLNPSSGYFMGIDIHHQHVNMALMNFSGELIDELLYEPLPNIYTQGNEALDAIVKIANSFLEDSGKSRDQIMNVCLSVPGRVNPRTGYSFSIFSFSEIPISETMSERLGIPVVIENDSRCMTYGEFLRGVASGKKNVLFINLSWGLGLGMLIDGELYEGQSGLAGELGHFPAFDNEIICHCGKKGCLETEVSGRAIQQILFKKMKEGENSILSEVVKIESPDDLTLEAVISAVEREDLLCIETLENVGGKLGKWIAGLINIFNPQQVVIGGSLSRTNEYLRQPVQLAINKYTLKLVSQECKVVCSKLGERAGVVGASLMARNRLLMD